MGGRNFMLQCDNSIFIRLVGEHSVETYPSW